MIHPAEIRFDWIDDNHTLAEFVDFAVTRDRYFLDTEFHREKTYFPELALIQVAAGDRLVLIDPLSVDVGEMRPLFEGVGTCVMHAAQQDLDVLTQACGFIPARILDTQLCAGFLGFSQPSLATLAQAIVKVTLPKGDRLSDWLKRPLTQDQMKYAAADVAYLEDISDHLVEQLEERSRLTWALDACEELRIRPTGPNAPEDAWLRVKDVRTLKGRARWVAKEVARWREQRAMELDLPPRHVLSDIAILGVAQKAPRSPDDLLQTRGIDGRHTRGRHGAELLDAIRTGVERARDGDLHFPASDSDDLDKSLRPAVTLVSAWVTELARQSDLDATLLGTRRDIVELLAGAPEARLTVGWRAEIVGRDIKDLVEGRKALTFVPGGGGRGLRLVEVTPN